MDDLYGRFADQVARVPSREAVRDGRRRLTYAELSDRVAFVAAALCASCPEPGSRIGLHLGRTADLPVAILAVVAAGHTYVPLDPGYPNARLSFMAQDSRLSLIISDRDVPAELPVEAVLRLDQLDWSTRAAPVPAPVCRRDDAAYVIYTSGSTGQPKGVVVRRSSVLAMLDAFCSRHQFDHRDVWTLFHSYCFDFSVWELWGALVTGATLVVVPADTAQSPRASAELLTREGVTVLSVVPSVFRYLAAAARELSRPPSTVRRVIFGGESIDVADIRVWRDSVRTDCEFINTYGITETTVFVTTRPILAAELESAEEERGYAYDLGQPLNGWDVRVLDEQGGAIGPGQTGEIWVGGAGLAIGYLHRPDLTAERFRGLVASGRDAGRYYRSGDRATLTDRGRYLYAGRTDDQVKINGFRIELGEIEAVLHRVSGLRDLAVVRVRSRIGGQMLAAFYATDRDPPPDLAVLARTALPGHMVPGRFVRLAALPRNPSGKTDRRALAERY